jgi:pimeloyl-ACP methyl ester carboxylesterase
MATGVHRVPHRVHLPHGWALWLLFGLLAAGGIAAGIDRAFLSGQTRLSWPPTPCVVQGVDARCGTFDVPENRARPNGRTIGLHVVVLPALDEASPRLAVAFLAGGPGSAATEEAIDENWQSSSLHSFRDLLLVDQRGTGGSKPPHGADPTQYGTRMAMDDLDAVRAALGYRKLDVFGGSYGATAAQVYLNLHPSSVRTLILSSATAIDVPFFNRYAVNAQRALDQLARLCDSQPACRKAFPSWERRFGTLVKAWNAHPVHGTTGIELAAAVHGMLRTIDTAVSIPLVVSRAAQGDYGPLEHTGPGDLGVHLDIMGSSIWCNEPWAGLDATGPWGTDFDSSTTAFIADFRKECRSVPSRAEPPSFWKLPTSSRVPVLAYVGGADSQDPVTNLADLKSHFADSRIVILPYQSHELSLGPCDNQWLATFVSRGTTRSLDTSCVARAAVVPTFPLTD